jgi:hypothetical protein
MFADERRMQTDISRMLKGQNMIENDVTPEELQRNIFNVECKHIHAVKFWLSLFI